MAYTYDVGVQVHVCGTHLLTPPSVQVEACISNFVIHEQHTRSLNPENQRFTNRVVLPKNGYLEVEDFPGLGIEWSEYALSEGEQFDLT